MSKSNQETDTKRSIEKLANEMLNESKKMLLRQHLYYKMTGTCTKEMDALVTSILKADKEDDTINMYKPKRGEK